MSGIPAELIELAPEHRALVRRVVSGARGRAEELLLLSDYYEQLSGHLSAGGSLAAALEARACAERLQAAIGLSRRRLATPTEHQDQQEPT